MYSYARWVLSALVFALLSAIAMSCQPSKCIDVCPAGISRCAAGGAELCLTNQSTGCTSWALTPCQAGQSCVPSLGRCVSGSGQCTNKHHQRRCVGQAVHWFDDCGVQGALIQQCPAGQSCQAGRCGGSGCQDACQEGQSQCTQEGWVIRCQRNPSTGCLIWSAPTTCPNNLRCKDNRCPGSPCQSTCTDGQRQCQGQLVQLCGLQATGCYDWNAPVACPTGQSCQGGQCQGGQDQCPASCTSHADCGVAACGTRNQCLSGRCSEAQAQCPASCSSDSQCNIPACGTKTACLQFSCQTPQAQCPGSCASDAQCNIPACGTKTACLQGTCQTPQAQCPGSCTANAQCNIPACGTKTSCTQGQCAAPSQISAAEQDLFDALNRARKANGLPPVAIDMKLMCAARVHAKDVGSTGSCGHVGSDGSWPWDRAQRCGFSQTKWTVNEIAAGPGFRDGDDAVSGWKASSGHWAAIVHTQAKTVGVAVHNTCFIAVFDCCVKGSD